MTHYESRTSNNTFSKDVKLHIEHKSEHSFESMTSYKCRKKKSHPFRSRKIINLVVRIFFRKLYKFSQLYTDVSWKTSVMIYKKKKKNVA